MKQSTFTPFNRIKFHYQNSIQSSSQPSKKCIPKLTDTTFGRPTTSHTFYRSHFLYVLQSKQKKNLKHAYLSIPFDIHSVSNTSSISPPTRRTSYSHSYLVVSVCVCVCVNTAFCTYPKSTSRRQSTLHRSLRHSYQTVPFNHTHTHVPHENGSVERTRFCTLDSAKPRKQ